MPGKRTIRGFTFPDLLAVLIALVLLTALALPALSQARDEAKITACANNLKQLAEADLKYASEFNGKFFYDWDRPLNIEGKEQPNSRARWWDKERIGRYLPGTPLQWPPTMVKYENGKVVNLNPPFINNAGLGGGQFACPADEGSMRSYNQNFWASGIDVPPPPELTKQNLLYWARLPGIFFNANSDAPHDRLILFGEMLAIASAIEKQGQTYTSRVTNDEFGSTHTPRMRFAGIGRLGSLYGVGAYGMPEPIYPTQLDYARHTTEHIVGPLKIVRPTIVGGINFAYADGHVAWREHVDLYNPQTGESTFRTVWSPVDQDVEKILYPEANHEWKIE